MHYSTFEGDKGKRFRYAIINLQITFQESSQLAKLCYNNVITT